MDRVTAERLQSQLLLMLNLAQLRDRAEIQRIFVEALCDMFPGARFQIQEPPAEESHVSIQIPLATRAHQFGTLLVEVADQAELIRWKPEVMNLAGLLAVVLENRVQTDELRELNRLLEVDIAQNRDLLAHITQSLPVYVYIFDLDTASNVYVDSSFAEALGLTPEEVRRLGNRLLPTYVHPEDLTKVRTHHIAVVAGGIGGSRSIEYRVRHRDGQWRWLLSIDTLYTRSESKNGMILGVAIDITERRAMADELRQALGQKELLLKEVNHRVKNNLALVSGLLSLQGLRAGNEAVTKALDHSRRRIQAMALIHEQLYTHESFTEVHLRAYLESLFEKIRMGQGGENITILLDGPHHNLLLSVDAAVTSALIIAELVANSLEHAFAPETGGEIRVAVELTEDGRVERLVVTDNGAGTDNADAFYTSDRLGLTLVRQLGRQLDLDIRATSSPEDGTTIELRRQKRLPEAVTPNPPDADLTSVFVVDDEAILVLDLVHWLEENQFACVGSASSGE